MAHLHVSLLLSAPSLFLPRRHHHPALPFELVVLPNRTCATFCCHWIFLREGGHNTRADDRQHYGMRAVQLVALTEDAALVCDVVMCAESRDELRAANGACEGEGTLGRCEAAFPVRLFFWGGGGDVRLLVVLGISVRDVGEG